MNEQWSLDRWETSVQRAARAFPYPPTPNIELPMKNYHNREDFRLRAEHAECAEKIFKHSAFSALSAVKSLVAAEGHARANAVKRRPAAKPAHTAFEHQRLAWTLAAALAVAFLATLPAAQSKLRELISMGAGHTLADVTPTLLSPTLTVTGLPSPTSMLLTVTPQPSSTPLSSAQAQAELPPYPFAPGGRLD